MEKRETKFRVKEIKNNIPNAEWSYFTIGDLACSNFSTEHDYFVGETWTQFTGLKDKTGNDIYEGDILEIIDGDIFSDNYKRIVEWSDRGFYKDFINYNKGVIIGNIYENADLIS